MAETIPDLTGLLGCLVLIAILYQVRGLFRAIAALLDVSILGHHPFGGLADAVENTVIAWCDAGIRKTEKWATMLFSQLLDAVGVIAGLGLLAAEGVHAGFEYLWAHALNPAIRAIVSPVRSVAEKAAADVAALTKTVASDLTKAESFARSQASQAVADAEAFAVAQVGSLRREAASEIVGAERAAVNEAHAYADSAVRALRDAEDAALTRVSNIATAAAAAAAAAEAEARSLFAQAESEAVIAAQAAASGAEAAALEAVNAVKSVAVTVEQDLATIEGALGVGGLAALIGALPAIITLVQALAVDTGLENASCRSKVKGICGTDPAAWSHLLAGLGLLAAPIGLGALVELGREVIGATEGLMTDYA